jgi:hypothetical protein
MTLVTKSQDYLTHMLVTFTFSSCWLPSLSLHNCNKVLSICHSSNSGGVMQHWKNCPNQLREIFCKSSDGVREEYCLRICAASTINYKQMKYGLGSNKKNCNPREEKGPACCRCWGGTSLPERSMARSCIVHGINTGMRQHLASCFPHPMVMP